jgi:ketosteroid isomerase-like protein
MFQMTPNQRTVEAYMDGFRRTDRLQILSCLTDDVEWEIPGVFHVHGKEAFDKHIVDDGFAGSPTITITRLTEGGDVVVAEGFVRAGRADGTSVNLAFCDVFDMRDTKIRRLVSYLMETGPQTEDSSRP